MWYLHIHFVWDKLFAFLAIKITFPFVMIDLNILIIAERWFFCITAVAHPHSRWLIFRTLRVLNWDYPSHNKNRIVNITILLLCIHFIYSFYSSTSKPEINSSVWFWSFWLTQLTICGIIRFKAKIKIKINTKPTTAFFNEPFAFSLSCGSSALAYFIWTSSSSFRYWKYWQNDFLWWSHSGWCHVWLSLLR